MKPAFLLLPVIATVAMWLSIKLLIKLLFRPVKPFKIGSFTLQGAIPKNQKTIAKKITEMLISELSKNEALQSLVTGPDVLEKILPSIEAHLDHFLKVKLKEALPVISMFIGEKVTNQLKDLFLNELQSLFPSVMSQLFDGLQHNEKLAENIYVRLCSIDAVAIEKHFLTGFRKDLNKIEVAFALVGFMTGLLQLLVVWHFS